MDCFLSYDYKIYSNKGGFCSMIKNFTQFGMLYEKIIFHEKLLSNIESINHPIANFLKQYALNNEDDYFEWVELSNNLNLLNTEKHGKYQQIKIGRFLKKVLPPDIKDHQIEEFIKLLKKNQIQSSNFEIWKGKKIKDAYLPSNFIPFKYGTLWSSCMSHEHCQPFLDLYEDNSNISVLVLLDINNKILGRAIVWNAVYHDGVEYKIMDYVYYSNYEFENSFIEYAKMNNWLYVNSEYGVVTDGVSRFNNEFTVKLEHTNYENYPFIDYMKYLDLKNSQLSNKKGDYLLQHSDGKLAECKTCQDHKKIMCPTCEGISTITDEHGETITCPTCEGHSFIDCPDCVAK